MNEQPRKNDQNPVCLEIVFHIKKGMADRFLAELTAFSKVVVQEPQCLDFYVFQDADDPNVVRISETWTSREFLENVQFKQAYYPPYFAKVADMWESPREMRFWTPLSTYRRSAP